MTKTHALALAGGGARGAYQAGAMLRLAELGARFDHVAGTSIGALNGTFWCQGDGSVEHARRMCELWRELPEAGVVRLNPSATMQLVSGPLLNQAPVLVTALELPVPQVRSFSVLDPEQVAAIMDKFIDYRRVCNSRMGLTVAVLPEVDPLVDIVTAPWRSAANLTVAELGYRDTEHARRESREPQPGEQVVQLISDLFQASSGVLPGLKLHWW